MKKQEIISLVNAGVLHCTTHSLTADGALAVWKFKQWLRGAYESLQSDEQSLLQECGIDDVSSFEQRHQSLLQLQQRSADEQLELDAMNASVSKFAQMQQSMLYEQVAVPTQPTLPFAQWKALQDENGSVSIGDSTHDIFSADAELVLHGILWDER